MLPVLIIVILTCVSLVVVVLAKPSADILGHRISLYWIVSFIGAVFLIAFRLVSIEKIWSGLTTDTAINPVKILVLFLSMTFMSVFLDEIGFFRNLASATLRKAKSSQTALFLYLYCMVSLLTVFTSNDIIILTFTPFICYFTKSARINPIPYLFAEFVAANTWSMALIIGNPTNAYLATSAGIGFLRYASVMLLPTAVAGCTAFLILYIIFRKQLNKRIVIPEERVTITDKAALIVGLAHLALCTLLLTVASYVGLEMWLITFVFAVSLCVFSLIMNSVRKTKKIPLAKAAGRIPFELIPFVLSMFVIVVSMKEAGITEYLAGLLGGDCTVFKYGFSSFAAANLINNIPMSVLFTSIIDEMPQEQATGAVYATVIGSNICAFFTPIGALAGIMWSGILKKHDVTFSFITYVKYGAAVSVPTLTAALAILNIIIWVSAE